jgi:hypothetical protein
MPFSFAQKSAAAGEPPRRANTKQRRDHTPDSFLLTSRLRDPFARRKKAAPNFSDVFAPMV